MVPANLLDQVLSQLARYPRGASLEDLLRPLSAVVSRRSLQRRLAEWVRLGKIQAEGVLKGRRYLLLVPPFRYPPAGERAAYSVREPLQEGYVPVSTVGEEVRLLLQPRMYDPDRIEFRREFLEGYRPNVTMYLPEHTRERLLAGGRVANPERPPGTFVRQVFDKLLIDLSWSSSRLEGSTYSFFETKRLIETGEAAPGKTPTETQMVFNHKVAIEFLVDSADRIGVNRNTILTLHSMLADKLLPDARAVGALRQAPVSIGGSGYRPTAIPQVIDECFQMILDKGAAIEDPFEQSFFLMVHLPYLQPFLDVNKRTSRLAANIPLIRRNLAPLSFIDVPERAYFDGTLAVYELNRVELLRDVYLWAYETSGKRYITAYDRIPAPNPMGLKYRKVLAEVINEVVVKGFAPEDAHVRTLAATRVEAADLDAFVELTLRELRGLHEFNIIRYRLPPLVFKEWESLYGTPD